jgi:hypothetical protein
MAAGLFYVYTEPGSVDEAEFHDWYDHEHGPARLKVPGFRSAYRYRALDDQKPPWLALYELDSPDVIDSPGYKALAAEASDRDKSVGASLATLDRRVYEQLSEDGSPVGRPAPMILAVALSVPASAEEDLAAWYTEEHIPMLLEVPGWRRIRRFRLIRAMDVPGPDFLSVHDLAGPEVLEEPRYRAAISTPWRDQVVAAALRRERRVFGLRNAIGD